MERLKIRIYMISFVALNLIVLSPLLAKESLVLPYQSKEYLKSEKSLHYSPIVQQVDQHKKKKSIRSDEKIDLRTMYESYPEEERLTCMSVLEKAKGEGPQCCTKFQQPGAGDIIPLAEKLNKSTNKCAEISDVIQNAAKKGYPVSSGKKDFACLEKELCSCQLDNRKRSKKEVEKELLESANAMIRLEDEMLQSFVVNLQAKASSQLGYYSSFLSKDFLDDEEAIENMESFSECNKRAETNLESCTPGMQKRILSVMNELVNSNKNPEDKKTFSDIKEMSAHLRATIQKKQDEVLKRFSGETVSRVKFIETVNKAIISKFYNLKSLTKNRSIAEVIASCKMKGLESQKEICAELYSIAQIYSVHPLLGQGDKNLDDTMNDLVEFRNDIGEDFSEKNLLKTFKKHVAQNLDAQNTFCRKRNEVLRKMCKQSNDNTGRLRLKFDIYSLAELEKSSFDKNARLYCLLQDESKVDQLSPEIKTKLDDVKDIYKFDDTDEALGDPLSLTSPHVLSLYDNNSVRDAATKMFSVRRPLEALVHCLKSTTSNDVSSDCRFADKEIQEIAESEDGEFENEFKAIERKEEDKFEKVMVKVRASSPNHLPEEAIDNTAKQVVSSASSNGSFVAPLPESVDESSNRPNNIPTTAKNEVTASAYSRSVIPKNSSEEIVDQKNRQIEEMNKKLNAMQQQLNKQKVVKEVAKDSSTTDALQKNIAMLQVEIEKLKNQKQVAENELAQEKVKKQKLAARNAPTQDKEDEDVRVGDSSSKSSKNGNITSSESMRTKDETSASNSNSATNAPSINNMRGNLSSSSGTNGSKNIDDSSNMNALTLTMKYSESGEVIIPSTTFKNADMSQLILLGNGKPIYVSTLDGAVEVYEPQKDKNGKIVGYVKKSGEILTTKAKAKSNVKVEKNDENSKRNPTAKVKELDELLDKNTNKKQ